MSFTNDFQAELDDQYWREHEGEPDLDDEDVRLMLADDDGCHTNEFGEVIAHAVTTELRPSDAVMAEILNAVAL